MSRNYGVYTLTMAKIVAHGSGMGIRARVEHRRVAGAGHRLRQLQVKSVVE